MPKFCDDDSMLTTPVWGPWGQGCVTSPEQTRISLSSSALKGDV